MKYIIGFIMGVVVTSLFFMWQNRSEQLRELPIISKPAISTNTSEGFQNFYQQFHEDSLFQIAHISFPLEGLPPQADSSTILNENFRWQKENWRMQKKFDTQDGEFTKELAELGSGMIIEQITHKTGQFGMQRRFAKIGGEWKLIYYSALNRIAEKQ